MNIPSLKDAADNSTFGGKAANLAKMLQAGLPVPGGLAVGLGAFNKEGTLNQEDKDQITDQLIPNKLYAVRSSALAEDAEGASWAGQFESFLNIEPKDVPSKVEECHNSAKARATAYASDKTTDTNFDIAVVVQEMINPEYAGVLFTKDPVTGEDNFVAEYVEGLGEELVSGRADPVRVSWKPGEEIKAPFNADELAELGNKVRDTFGVPQDIEWAWAENKMWLVQARPITTTANEGKGYYLGEPENLFYWGPSRAQPMYMSDFMAGIDQCFPLWANDKGMPTPPKTLVLFNENKMVWLNNAVEFGDWVEQMFLAYEKAGHFEADFAKWKADAEKLKTATGADFKQQLVQAWVDTEFAEFSLYGAESALAKRLQRFDDNARQRIWGAFTTPDNGTFLNRIDEELRACNDPEAIAIKYPWIEDGYAGPQKNAKDYFAKRLEVVRGDPYDAKPQDREALAKELGLAEQEISSLTLARQLAEFMDERKAWMMQTRHLITENLGAITDGWVFDNGEASLINKVDTEELWERYINFRSSSSAVRGIVASNGGRHFVNGEVVVVDSPTDVVEAGKILVVPSTSPSYVPLMRRARALVTDHGGMMSHAAIVAREFGLPCIVGTKQATKALKTGDKVVLDLVKGEVSK